MARFRRKDLKLPDPFVSGTQQAWDWAQENRNQVFVAIGGVAAVVLVVIAVMSSRAAQLQQANEELAQGLAQLSASHYAEAATKLNEVAERWQGTTAGTAARLYAAHAQLEAKNSAAAASTLKPLVDSGVSPSYLNQEATLSLAYVSEDGGDIGKAAELYEKARNMDGPFTSIALLGSARCRDKMGDKARAIELYQSFLDEYPASKDETYISARLAELKQA